MSAPEETQLEFIARRRLEKALALAEGNPQDLGKEVGYLRRRRQAAKLLDDEEQAEKAEEMAARVESLWLDRDDLDDLPGPEPLLGNLLFRKSVVVLAGAPGSFKSFVALDWAASVTTGKAWQGHAAERGTVVYLAGEGDTGLPKRILAWEQANNRGVKAPVKVFPRPAALHKPDDAETKAMVESIIRRKPDLVVIDTLARYTPGMNENSAEDMGLFVQVASRIKDETGACVVIVHHTTKDDGTERGSSALRGASDALYMMKSPNKSKRTVEFYVDRAKEEASGGDAVKLALEVVATPKGSSLVIPRVDPFVKAEAGPPASMPTRKSPNLVKLLWNVYVHMRTTGVGWTEAQVRGVVKASDLNLGKYEKQRWPEVWGVATDGGYLTAQASRWRLDVAKVRTEFGFCDEAENYYREHVMDGAPKVPDAEE
ncbi:helicase RepA family protein [uncultured Gordonia sp.]|uniref:helicase RepA family protein n=1 Tax=uncultured Gordonia sp. TaxID=198437 RepID=UPI0025964433|nr:helicase RepA family protein [uncultured Gordonia sp.]